MLKTARMNQQNVKLRMAHDKQYVEPLLSSNCHKCNTPLVTNNTRTSQTQRISPRADMNEIEMSPLFHFEHTHPSQTFTRRRTQMLPNERTNERTLTATANYNAQSFGAVHRLTAGRLKKGLLFLSFVT